MSKRATTKRSDSSSRSSGSRRRYVVSMKRNGATSKQVYTYAQSPRQAKHFAKYRLRGYTPSRAVKNSRKSSSSSSSTGRAKPKSKTKHKASKGTRSSSSDSSQKERFVVSMKRSGATPKQVYTYAYSPRQAKHFAKYRLRGYTPSRAVKDPPKFLTDKSRAKSKPKTKAKTRDKASKGTRSSSKRSGSTSSSSSAKERYVVSMTRKDAKPKHVYTYAYSPRQAKHFAKYRVRGYTPSRAVKDPPKSTQSGGRTRRTSTSSAPSNTKKKTGSKTKARNN
jgi:hypothetical protein